MSIIHDALKKLQQGRMPKTDETPIVPATTAPQNSGYLYSTPEQPATQAGQQKIEYIQPVRNKIKSVLALMCAIVITLGAFGFFFKQLNTHFPQVRKMTKSSFYKLIHKKELPDFKTKSPEDLKPLAQITINQPATSSAQSAVPVTLNVHGIMSNATGNLALINDQVYQEGDDIDGAKIVKISLDSITVNINGTEKTIFVKN